jgi:hypothetical protein
MKFQKNGKSVDGMVFMKLRKVLRYIRSEIKQSEGSPAEIIWRCEKAWEKEFGNRVEVE